MVSSDATTPDEYLAELAPDRRAAIAAVRDVVRRNLPEGFEEGMQFGMIAYYVPLDRFPNTYNGRPLGLAAIASQKNHMAIYLNNVYGDRETERRFRERYAASGKKLDMGKSCVRFRKLDALPLEVIGTTIAETNLERSVARYVEIGGSSRAARAAATKG